jgi:predicted O-linked N-acetylglucosamine transferase (SPINDLY family)
MTIEQAVELAVQHHRAGRVREAEALYSQVLVAQPGHADALHLLGVLAHQSGRTEFAIQLIQRAIAANPGIATYHSNLGIILAGEGRFGEAIEAHHKAAELQPGAPEAHDNLAAAYLGAGRLEDAASEYRASLAHRPDHAEARCNLGHVLRLLGRHDEAMAELHQALALRPNFPQAYNNLGIVWHEKGNIDQAIFAYRHSLALRPDSVETLGNLSLALERKGQFDEAIAASSKLIALEPQNADAHYRLGHALRARGRLQEAAEAYRKAVALRPGYADAVNNLGIIYSELALIDDAITAYRRAIELRTDFAGAHNNLGNALKDTGQFAEAIACYRRSLEIEPNSQVAGNLLYTLHFDPETDAKRLADEHAEWNRIYAKPLAAYIRPHDNDRSPDRRLRVGYVSRDLRVHPVGRFLAPLLSHHNHEQFEVFCYSDVTRPDALTDRLRGCADNWRDVVGLSDEALAEQVRFDRIDVLVDLAMHMDGTRMLAFARKPAPVQVTYLAYVSTTGLETMDYRLTDAYLDPPSTSSGQAPGIDESVYSEKSVLLPHSYWCYEPPEGTPAVNESPALAKGYIAFGCLNNFAKASGRALATWAEILRRVPKSELILHSGEGSHRQRVRDQFARAGIEPQSLRIVGRVQLEDYFRQYHEIDIALDPFPYPGGTTTCDALWMGVPVVTLAGEAAASRGGVSILSNVGFPELIASDTERYVQIAVSLAEDPSRLTGLRSRLRQQMITSPLMDAPQFARDVETAFREMWRKWCGV